MRMFVLAMLTLTCAAIANGCARVPGGAADSTRNGVASTSHAMLRDCARATVGQSETMTCEMGQFVFQHDGGGEDARIRGARVIFRNPVGHPEDVQVFLTGEGHVFNWAVNDVGFNIKTIDDTGVQDNFPVGSPRHTFGCVLRRDEAWEQFQSSGVLHSSLSHISEIRITPTDFSMTAC